MSILLSNIPDDIIGKRVNNILISSTKQYPAVYTGKITPISLYGCRYLASRLNDIYDEENNRLVKNKFLELPYFDLISSMSNSNKILLWLGPSWFLAGLKTYIERGENLPDLEIFNLPQPMGYMIFLELDSIDMADQLYQEINLEFNTYDDFNYRAVENVSLIKALDLKQLFPLDFFILGKYTIFASDQLNDRQMEHAINHYRLIMGISKVDKFIGTFAAYLTMEQTNYLYPIKWTGNELWIDYSGYVYGQKLYNLWIDNLTNIISTNNNIKYVPVSKERAAYNGKYKAIWIDGIYYLVVDGNFQSDNEEYDRNAVNWDSAPNLDELHIYGYNKKIINEPKWKYPDLIKDIDESIWYQTTYGPKYKIADPAKTNDAKATDSSVTLTFDEIDNKYRNGGYFSKTTNAMVNALNGFIPSFVPITTDLIKVIDYEDDDIFFS